MQISNKTLLNDIQAHGMDVVINNVDIEQIEDLTIKIICRTIQESKNILQTTLEEFVAEENHTSQEPAEVAIKDTTSGLEEIKDTTSKLMG